MLRMKLAERTEERDELISDIFKMQGMINHCYYHMDKMSDIAVGVDTLYKRCKRNAVEDSEDSSDLESCSCGGAHSESE